MVHGPWRRQTGHHGAAPVSHQDGDSEIRRICDRRVAGIAGINATATVLNDFCVYDVGCSRGGVDNLTAPGTEAAPAAFRKYRRAAAPHDSLSRNPRAPRQQWHDGALARRSQRDVRQDGVDYQLRAHLRRAACLPSSLSIEEE